MTTGAARGVTPTADEGRRRGAAKRRGVRRWSAVGTLGLGMVLSAAAAGSAGPVAATPTSAAPAPAVQPKLPDVPPKVPELPPAPPVPPGKPPIPPPPPGLPEQPGRPGQPDRPRTPDDDLNEANKKLRQQNAELQRRLDERAALTGAPVKHLVVLWLKKPGDQEGRKALVAAKDTLRNIPGVIDVSVGECLPSDRKVVDSSYDIAMVITLASEKALKEYGPHPAHQKLLIEVVKPNVEKYVVYDFVAK